MPIIKNTNKIDKDNTKIVNARVSEEALNALSLADKDSYYSFTLTGIIRKAIEDTLNDIHLTTGVDYCKLIQWEKKIKNRFENDDIQSVVRYDYHQAIPPWILDMGSTFNLIFKNYSTLDEPKITASESVAYLSSNASTSEKEYFQNTLIKATNLAMVGPIWKPWDEDNIEYRTIEALKRLSKYIFKEHFLNPVIHIYLTQDDNDELSMMKSQIVHYLKQHPQVVSFCSCPKVQGGNTALFIYLKPLKNGLDFKILFENVKQDIYQDVSKFENFDDLLKAKEMRIFDEWNTAFIFFKSKEVEVKLKYESQNTKLTDRLDETNNNSEFFLESMNIGDWSKFLSSELNKPYFKSLNRYLNFRLDNNIEIFPSKENWFKALEFSSFKKTKVVILGQDPYHGEGQADGFCFSVSNGMKIPPSLKNIFEELVNDEVDFTYPHHGNLDSWAQQGVLLINSVLTVEKNSPTSHTHIGWESFTDNIIKTLSDNKNNLVFLLWGANANTKSSLINSDKHLVLRSVHPSPFSATKETKGLTKFTGCKHFSQTNKYLNQNNIETINWSIPK
jgi:uracil-DNA glycosylase